MANIAFPQLSSGALVQYPLRKRRLIQSVVNTFADGSTITSNTNGTSQRVWELEYLELSDSDRAALESHFAACRGPLQSFTFIDPTGNMLSHSTDLTRDAWDADPLLSISGGATDPFGGNAAFSLNNVGQTVQFLRQQIPAPSNFRYCLSVYASAPTSSTLTLGWDSQRGQSLGLRVGQGWRRLTSSNQLTDNLPSLTIMIGVPAAQTVSIWGPQFEPQVGPSHYRPTVASGGVYENAHLLGDSITFTSDAPGLFSTSIRLETT